MQTRRTLTGLVLLLLAWATLLGCREEVPPLFRRNRPPETSITVIAEDSTAAFYSYRVYWRGEDPDGQVVRFLFAITDTLGWDDVNNNRRFDPGEENEEKNWDPSLAIDRERGIYTALNDSVFLFDSNAGRQVINIVAIDDFGEMDPTPARAYFQVVDNGLPTVRFLNVTSESSNPEVLPCVAAEPCTIPTFTNFTLRFSGQTSNGSITGYTWQAEQGLWEPFYTVPDTFFLAVTEVDGDTTGTDQFDRFRWALSADHDTVTVLNYSSREEPITPGNFSFRVRVRDQARRTSLLDRGVRVVTVNYDPDTRLFSIPECDCPTAPPGCQSTQDVTVGWVTGIGLVDTLGMQEWQIFCPGDTIPNLSTVNFYANGWDDRRDLPIDPGAGLAEVEYSFRFEYGVRDFSSTSMPFSTPFRSAMDLPLPSGVGGGSFRGAAAGWRTCPFNYRFEAGSVDENGKIDDGTPASMDFYVSGSPVVDSLVVPKVLVFLPACPDIFAQVLCPWQVNPPVFGPDTLVVLGTHIADETPPVTPLGLGFNDFNLPLRAYGHDHPRDRNRPGEPQYYNSQTEGRIRAWKFKYDCIDPNCADLALPGEGVWREDRKAETDPPGQEVFDDALRIRVLLDTLCTVATAGTRCPLVSTRAEIRFDRFGRYEFRIEGRDTEFIGQTCPQPSDLGNEPSTFIIPISELGRTTQMARAVLAWRQYSEVRPVRKVSASTASPSPFATPKRLMP